MATRGIDIVIGYVAWDTAANKGRTGDAANHTLRWLLDGTLFTPPNAPSEIDATNMPGVYKVAIPASLTDGNIGILGGASSSASVSILPQTIQFERLPDADPGGAGGVPTANANNEVLTDLDQILPSPQIAGSVGDALASVKAISPYSPNAVEVTHDYGGEDNFSYLTSDGTGIDNAVVIAYLKTDYEAGRRSPEYYRGATETNVQGQWVKPLLLDPGTYIIYFYKQGEYGPDTKVMTVTAP